MKRKRGKKVDLPERGFEPRIFEQIPAQNLNFLRTSGLYFNKVSIHYKVFGINAFITKEYILKYIIGYFNPSNHTSL